jgi:methylenetetrahydrofolate dehydrogenase (NAD+)
MPTPIKTDCEEPPAGTVKSIIPCTPLAIVKSLEFIGIYNKILPYGDRAYGKTITVINRYVHHKWLRDLFYFKFFRSEVVGRPLAALLANDGARVLSVDIESIQVKLSIPSQRRKLTLFSGAGIYKTSSGNI